MANMTHHPTDAFDDGWCISDVKSNIFMEFGTQSDVYGFIQFILLAHSEPPKS